MSTKMIVALVVAAIMVIVIVAFSQALVGHNDAQNWQIIQSLGGKITVRDMAGWYPKMFATVTTYPRYVEATYNDIADEGNKSLESVRATFNDGGTAQISTYVRFETPTEAKARMNFHQQFSGNMENARNAVKAHQTNCIKATAPLMSSSENQSARKAEFASYIEQMLSNGLYEMKKIQKTLKDKNDENGKPITVFATEIILDDKGMPTIQKISPLSNYGIVISQFSVTEIEYDPETKEQFAAKKRSFLAAEQSKAMTAEMVQERLMIVEKGKKDKAEAEAKANVIMAKAVIEAEQKANVALQAKVEQETKAKMLLSVAEIEKKQALTVASKGLEVATIVAKTAEQSKIATIAEAEGRQKSIELSGAITEKEKVLAQIAAEKDVQVAKALSSIKTPSVVFNGGSGVGGGGNYTDTLMNLTLLKALGIVPTDLNGKIAAAPITIKK